MAINGDDDGDDVNQSTSDDFGSAELARIGEMARRTPAAQRELRERHKQATIRRQVINGLPKDDQSLPLFKKHFQKSQEALSNLTPRIKIFRESQQERINAQAVNTINRQFSESRVNSFAASQINSQDVQMAGMSLSSQPFDHLAAQRTGIMNQISSLRSDSINAAGSLVGGHGIDREAQMRLQENAARVKDLSGQLAPISVAMKQQRAMGQDPESRQQNLVNMGQKAAGLLHHENLKEMVENKTGMGKFSGQELKDKEREAAEKLVKALDELRSATGKSKDELLKLNKVAEESAKTMQDVADIRGAGGGGGKSGGRNLQDWGGGIAQVAMAAASGIQRLGIDQPLQGVANATGAANLENQKYEMYKSAVSGNMTARMNLTGLNSAQSFGNKLATRANAVVAATGVAGAATTTIGVGQGAEVMNPLADAVSGTTVTRGAEAAGNVIQGGTMVAAAGMDYHRQLSAGSARLAGNQAVMGFNAAINHVTGAQVQQYRDFSVGLTEAGIGMGNRAGNFLNEAGSTGFLGKMGAVGLGTNEAVGLAHQGANSIGSQFNAGQMIEAKRLEQIGAGSASTNIERMGMLAGAGSQNPSSMASILETAVSKGLGSSKALDMIAQHTGQLVQQSVGRNLGIDTTKAAAAGLLNATDTSNPNKEMALDQAQGAKGYANQWGQNTAMSWSGFLDVQRIGKRTGLKGWKNQHFAQLMDPETIKSIMGMSKDQQKFALHEAGVDVTGSNFDKDSNGFFNGLLSAKSESIGFGSGLGAIMGNGKFKTALDWARNNPERAQQLIDGHFITNKKDPNYAGTDIRGAREGLIASANEYHIPGGAPQLVREMLTTSNINFKQGSAPGDASNPTNQKTFKDILLTERAGAARQSTDAASAAFGGRDVSGAQGGQALIQSYVNTRNNAGGEGAEKDFQDKAAKSAESFGESVKKFDTAIGSLEKAAQHLMQVGLSNTSAGSDDAPKTTFPSYEDEQERKQTVNRNSFKRG